MIAFGSSPAGTWVTLGGVVTTCTPSVGDYFYEVPKNSDAAGNVLCLDHQTDVINTIDVNFYNTSDRGDFDLRLCERCPQ